MAKEETRTQGNCRMADCRSVKTKNGRVREGKGRERATREKDEARARQGANTEGQAKTNGAPTINNTRRPVSLVLPLLGKQSHDSIPSILPATPPFTACC